MSYKNSFYESSEEYLSTIETDEPDSFEQTEALMMAYDVAEMYIKELELKADENEHKAKAFDEVSKISRHVFIKDKDKLKMIDKVVESEAD